MIKAILLDADGTLFDSTLPSMERHRELAGNLGLTVPTIEQLKQVWGGDWNDEVRALTALVNWPDNAAELFKWTYLESYHTLSYQPIPQAAAAVRDLHRAGFKLGIITNRDKETLIRRIKEAGIEPDWFYRIQVCSDHEFRKPDPRVFTPILQALFAADIRVHETIYVGDIASHDLAAAAAHNPPIKFVAVTTGLNTAEEFLAAGLETSHILPSIAHLPEWLKNTT